MNNYTITIQPMKIEKELIYKNSPIIKYSINYPRFHSTGFIFFLNKLNSYYKSKAVSTTRYCETELYRNASEYYDTAITNSYPFYEYEYQVVFSVENTQDYILSLYFDESSYTGGANGTTKRSSDNWNLAECRRIELQEMFPSNWSYQDFLVSEVNRIINERIKFENGNYFDTNENLAEKYFSDDNFYLKPESLEIFYQEITVAPHSSGVIVFEFPYVPGPIKPAIHRPVKNFGV